VALIAALQLYASGSGVEYLPQPIRTPGGQQVVGFRLDAERVVRGGGIGVTLHGRGLAAGRALRLVITPTALAPTVETPIVPELRGDLEELRVVVQVPAHAAAGAHSLRVPGRAQTFAHFEVLPR